MQIKAYKLKTEINFTDFFVPKEEAFMYIIWKMLYLYSKCDFLWLNRNVLCFVGALYFCASRPSLGAKSGLADDFSQKFFHLTPYRNRNVGRVPETFQNPVFLVTANSQPQKKNCWRNFRENKNNFLGTWLFSPFKAKIWFFVQESAAEFIPFIFCKNNFWKN